MPIKKTTASETTTLFTVIARYFKTEDKAGTVGGSAKIEKILAANPEDAIGAMDAIVRKVKDFESFVSIEAVYKKEYFTYECTAQYGTEKGVHTKTFTISAPDKRVAANLTRERLRRKHRALKVWTVETVLIPLVN